MSDRENGTAPLFAYPGELEIKRIYLLNRFQGSGLGKLLMSHAIERARAGGARRLLLGVYSENTGAIAFYQRLGFETVGHRPFKVGTMVLRRLRHVADVVASRVLKMTPPARRLRSVGTGSPGRTCS